MPSQPSIRGQLEADAWRNHRQFARRQSSKRSAMRTRLRWEDRALLIISAVLLLLLKSGLLIPLFLKKSIDRTDIWTYSKLLSMMSSLYGNL